MCQLYTRAAAWMAPPVYICVCAHKLLWPWWDLNLDTRVAPGWWAGPGTLWVRSSAPWEMWMGCTPPSTTTPPSLPAANWETLGHTDTHTDADTDTQSHFLQLTEGWHRLFTQHLHPYLLCPAKTGSCCDWINWMKLKHWQENQRISEKCVRVNRDSYKALAVWMRLWVNIDK